MERAEASGALFHRSGTEQLEHWAALGAAVETVLGLPAVARLKALGKAPDIDSLLARVGTPAGNKKLAKHLRALAFPQYGAGPSNPGDVLEFAGISDRSPHRVSDSLPDKVRAGR